jgi:recombination protein RecA
MSAARVPVSLEEISRYVFQVSHGAGREHAMELPQVLPASRLGENPAPAMVSTGIEKLDALTGGLPRGALSEICGPASSGRTSVLLSLMASMTANGEVCALVDTADSFDPKSAEAAGVELRKLLWIRCSKNSTLWHRDTGKRISDCRLSIADCGRSDQWPVRPSRRQSQISNRKSQMDSLEQTLKATDLLLQGGGFGLVVVDLADVPTQAARRVPLTSWFRFRRAVENTRTVLVVLEQEPYAKTCASVVVKLSAISSQLSARLHSAGARLHENHEPPHARILSGLQITGEILRSPTQPKKPVQSAHPQWESKTAWVG